MTTFKDLAEILEPLVLPIRGKEYTIPPLSFQDGERVNAIVDGSEKLTDEEFYRLLLSDAMFDELIADGAPARGIDRIARTALTDYKFGRELALIMWETGGDAAAIEALQKQRTRAKRRTSAKG
jgi:hypothetical protein